MKKHFIIFLLTICMLSCKKQEEIAVYKDVTYLFIMGPVMSTISYYSHSDKTNYERETRVIPHPVRDKVKIGDDIRLDMYSNGPLGGGFYIQVLCDNKVLYETDSVSRTDDGTYFVQIHRKLLKEDLK